MKRQFLLSAASFVVVVAGMKAAKDILVPFLLAIFIAVICAPSFLWLKRKKLPTGFALLIVISGILLIGFGIGGLLGNSISDFSRSLPVYQQRLEEQTRGLREWLAGHGIEIGPRGFLDYFDPKAVMQFSANVLSGLGGVLSDTFLITLTVIFILLEASSFSSKLRAISTGAMANWTNIMNSINRYLVFKTLISLGTGLVIGTWLAVLRVDFALLWGVLAFLLNYVPNIGSIIAALPAVLMAFLQYGAAHAVLAGIGYTVVNVVLGNMIEPRFMGRGLGLSTLVVFLSLVLWGWVLGPVGMLLSVPLTMTVKIALEHSDQTRWIAILLGPEIEDLKETESSPKPKAEQ